MIIRSMQNTTTFKEIFSFIWQHIKPQKWAFFFIIFFALGWSLESTIWPYILRVVIDILTQYETTRDSAWEALKVPVFSALAFWTVVPIGFRIQGFLMAKAFP